MGCVECVRLVVERAKRERMYLDALGDLTAMENGAGTQYMSLRAIVMEAELDLKLTETQFRQHRDGHTVDPDRGGIAGRGTQPCLVR